MEIRFKLELSEDEFESFDELCRRSNRKPANFVESLLMLAITNNIVSNNELIQLTKVGEVRTDEQE